MSANIYTRLASLERGCQDLLAAHPNLTLDLIDVLEQQEEALVFPTLSNDQCLNIGIALHEAVKVMRDDFKPVTIDIEINGRTVFHYEMPGTSPDNDMWIARKKRTVKHFERSSYLVGRSLHLSGKSWAEKYDGLEASLYAAHGGCFPIRLQGGLVVGTITMSGLAQVLDHVTIVRVLMKEIYGEPVQL